MLEWLRSVPPWVLVGVVLGAVGIAVVVGLFVAGARLFPAPTTESSTRRVDGTDRRRAEIRTYLDGIGERYVEDSAVHDDVVAFYLPRRDVAITFDPQAYFRIEDAGTEAVLCEYEMPGAHLGRRLPFETPTRERTATNGEPGRPRDAFARLGLPPTAGVDEVTAAYRRQVKDVHPDHGGDSEAFRELQEAYTTAKEHAD